MSWIRSFFCVCAFLLTRVTSLPTKYDDSAERDIYDDEAVRILTETPLVDGHNDLAWTLILNFEGYMSRFDLETDMRDQIWNPNTDSQTDIPRLRQGLASAQFWSLFTRCNVQYKDGIQKALELIDMMKRVIAKYDHFFKFVTTADGILQAKAEGKFASLLGLEGGHMISSSLGTLRMFYDLGVRYMTLAWNCNTPWADYSNAPADTITPMIRGLSDWGKLVISEMNRLGMLVDLAHVSTDTMNDALDVSVAPVIFSHSSAYGICPHRRNVPDDILLRLRDNRGIIMINFYTKFLNCTLDNRYESGYRSSSIDQLIDHMDYVKNLIGVDFIGIGSDYDGIDYTPDGLEDTSRFPALVAQMLRRGWTNADVEKVIGLNIIRVFREVEMVRDGLLTVEPEERLMNYTLIPDLTCSILPNWDQ